jgi:putative tryptophan/tyrosine transport system substrate-binding protein
MDRISLSLIFMFLVVLPEIGADTTHRVAVVISRRLGPYAEAAQGIRQYFRDQSSDAVIDQYDLEGDPEKAAQITSEIVNRNTNLIFAVGTEATQAALTHTENLPVVTSMVYDPRAEGMIEASQEKRVYGALLAVPWDTQFELIRNVMPSWKRLAIIYRPEGNQELIAAAEAEAQTFGFELVLLPLSSMLDFSQTVREARKKADALVMVLDRVIYNRTTTKELFLFSARHKFPIISFSPNHVKSGALISLSTNFHQNGKDAASIGIFLLQSEKVKHRFVASKEVWITWNKHVANALEIKLSAKSEKRINEFL